MFETKRDKATGDQKKCIMRSCMTFLFTRYCENGKIKANEKNKADSTKGNIRSAYKCLVENLKGRDSFGRWRRRSKDVLESILEKWIWRVWIESAWFWIQAGGRLL
jgi:hypothetical protein